MSTYGDTGNPSQNTIYYDALLTTTLAAYAAGTSLVDNIFKDSAFLAFLRMSEAYNSQVGGQRISMPLMYGLNDTVKSYSGYDTIDTTPQEGFTTAHYPWKEMAGSITISRLEEKQNSGEAQIINLLKSKITQAEMSMREKVNQQLLQGTVESATFVPGNSAKDLYPLAYFLRKDNTTDPITGGNVGNIAGATESWWRHRTAVLDSASKDTGNDFAVNVSTYAGLKLALHRMYNTCALGSGGSPNVCIADQITLETYENALDQQVRYTNQKMGDIGFDNIKLKGATMVFDEVVPDVDSGTAALTTGTAFFLNTKFYNLIYEADTEFPVTPFIEADNATIKTAKILFMGNAAISNMRKHGVCYGISQAIAS